MTDTRLIRITYISRSGSGAGGESRSERDLAGEIDAILEVSRRNNGGCGVTGALIFNRGTFGQILEGPEDAVEETFLRIEGDPRHHDVEVLDLKPVTARAFGDWSMGFVGREASMSRPEVEARRTTLDLARMDGDEVFALLHQLALGRDTAIRAA